MTSSGDVCGATKRDGSGDTCQLPAGWGTDHVGEGRCKHHDAPGGAREGAGAPEDNRNAVDHSLYSDSNLYYQEDCDESDREFIDGVFEDYRERYVEQQGEPPRGDEARLFKIAVNVHKELRADDWPVERPAALDSGHPLVDRSEKRTAQGEPYYEFVESPVLRAEARLSQKTRMWLKDLGLLNDPDSEQAAAEQDKADLLREILE